MKTIKNIIFDLGGVILNLDVPKTISELQTIGIDNIVNKTGHHYEYSFFYDFEIGKISKEEFLEALFKLSSKAPNHEAIKVAWNAMILDMPKARIAFIESLKGKYNLYLLSNTNAIHQKHFLDEFETANGYKFNNLFTKAYYSHEVKIRKPDAGIFNFLLKDSNLKPEESIFIDDSIDNIKAAENLGIQTFHVKDYNLLSDFASQVL
ncbi:HAD family hydrolase [Algibacter lectus]|uniref:Haloacid dehalogenase-like hydrolase n=1 Tax=Algibacter lectus TaxID=221126 RepID=A0A090WQH0_9FLAO|nr:HAD family phosphatase [Algibacter lectus]MDO7137262.1 HAD family phosphatase [Algibacter lectus]MWW24243.1 HAD-IA family hydrolase [Algibacter lectus]TDY62261.1 putative hydrolase of the HAD superfamily [Algibacter lectus]SFC71368.1 putative hydrolase of the HAD superfamily [Algibacter lectus]GAL60716.1 haloacid dehalogenase-like hydrolase [Algibacter lectus]